jgi:acyl carrier protein
MDRHKLVRRARRCVARQLDVPLRSVVADGPLTDLEGFDSLDLLDLILCLEDHLDVALPNGDVKDLLGNEAVTIVALVKCFEKLPTA